MALFRVLGRHRSLFLAWLPLSGLLLRGSALSHHDVELVIVRVAHLRGCDYELDHHHARARRAGVDPEAVTKGAAAGRDRVLLDATDALIRDRDMDDVTWAAFRAHFTERAAIELCFLAGHYDLLATTITTLRIPRDV
jgi:AhpD family alkylhydroperoxidase